MKFLRRLRDIGIIPMMYKFCYRYIKYDEDLNAIAARNGAYHYLSRYLHVFDPQPEPQLSNIKETKYIWVCWFQGEENAPQLVKCCIESIRNHCKDRTVVLLTDNNINEFIDIPEYIVSKRNAGMITKTHFSDIIRIMLLSKYGGIWIDSTVMMTGPVPQYIIESPFFVFHTVNTSGHVLCATGLMASCPHHPIIEDVQSLLFHYWQKEKRMVSYSLIHLMITAVIEHRESNRLYWESVPIHYFADNELLRVVLNRPFNQGEYEQIKEITSIHKLTYKFSDLQINPNKRGSFYDVLINHNIR